MPRGRTLSLLALLLVNRGSIVHVDRAVDELWGGADPQHGRKAVQVLASRLRAALDGRRARHRGRRLRAAAAGRTASTPTASRRSCGAAARSSRAASRARRRPRCGRRSRCGAARRSRTSPASASPSRRRRGSRTLRLACLADRIDADLACGRHEELVGELEALVQQHPHDERLRARQMLALYRAGRQADALDAYRAAYEALADGLGIEPSAELRSLEAAILRHERARAGGAAGAAAAARRAPARDVRASCAPRSPAPTRSRCARGSSATTSSPPRRAPATAAASPRCAASELLLAFGTPRRARGRRAARPARRRSELRGDALALGVGTGDVGRPADRRGARGGRAAGAARPRRARSGSTSRRGGSCATAPAPRSCRAARSC